MAPKYSQSQKQLELVEVAERLQIQFPKGSIDLEQRAMVARKLVGGEPARGLKSIF